MSPLRRRIASCIPRREGAVLVGFSFSSFCGRRMRTPGCPCASTLAVSRAASATMENKMERALFIEFGNPVAIGVVFGLLFDAARIELQETDGARIERDRAKVAAGAGHFGVGP